MNILLNSLFLLIVGACLASVDAQKTCGKSNSPRIVGGVGTTYDTWPWQCLLTTKFQNAAYRQVGYRCGGTLISEDVVLTAAHCFFGRQGETFVGVDVRLGETFLTSTEKSEVYVTGKHVIIHANYDPDTNNNDIAIIKLEKPLNFATTHSHLQPICLPPAAHADEANLMRDTDYANCYATGFGDMTNGGNSATQLQEVKLEYLPNAKCKDIWRSKVNVTNMLCAGPTTGGRDTCQGDSGGPWQCKMTNGAWTIQGATSFGGKCAAAGLTGVYTRVAFYVDWIKENMV